MVDLQSLTLMEGIGYANLYQFHFHISDIRRIPSSSNEKLQVRVCSLQTYNYKIEAKPIDIAETNALRK